MRLNPDNTRPLTLIFVRHGESAANPVYLADKHGDSTAFTPEFRNTANAEFGLTDRGIQQAQTAGNWIRANIQSGIFDAYYASSFKRARQTAGHLSLTGTAPLWKIRDYLIEQSHGYADNLPRAERDQMYPEIARLQPIQRFHFRYPGGESMSDVTFRAKIGIIDTLYREVPQGSALVVSHENFLWGVRTVIEGLTPDQYYQLDTPNNPSQRMHNCQVLEYTRVNPDNPENVAANFAWMRSICPWNFQLTPSAWVDIKRPKYTSRQLLEL